jgi:periplasmic divalent cation tolerance protein
MTDSTPQARIVLATAANPEEATRLARTLVEERLAACATLLVLKTGPEQLAALEARLHQLHSYQTPEFLVLTVESGSPGYLDWLQASLSQP